MQYGYPRTPINVNSSENRALLLLLYDSRAIFTFIRCWGHRGWTEVVHGPRSYCFIMDLASLESQCPERETFCLRILSVSAGVTGKSYKPYSWTDPCVPQSITVIKNLGLFLNP